MPIPPFFRVYTHFIDVIVRKTIAGDSDEEEAKARGHADKTGCIVRELNKRITSTRERADHNARKERRGTTCMHVDGGPISGPINSAVGSKHSHALRLHPSSLQFVHQCFVWHGVIQFL
jgi:hypothetical protein